MLWEIEDIKEELENINIENLVKLKNWVLSNVNDDEFHMGEFRSTSEGDSCTIPIDISIHKESNECGTAGCLLGWAPFVPGLEAKKEDYVYTLGFLSASEGRPKPKAKNIIYVLSFKSYALRVFNASELNCLFDYLFAGEWVWVDNTISGASKRIEVLEKLVNNPELLEHRLSTGYKIGRLLGDERGYEHLHKYTEEMLRL